MNSLESFQVIDANDIPEQVEQALLHRARLYVAREQAPSSLDGLRRLTVSQPHDNGDVTYVAEQTKTYFNDETEDLTHFVDISPVGDITGVSEVRFNPAPTTGFDFFTDKPFVGWTETDKEHRHEGLGRRRLLTMAVYTRATLGLALHSDTLMAHSDVIAIWDRLVGEGKATRYMHGDHQRFRFDYTE